MQIKPNRERCLRRFNNEIQNTLINCKAKPQYTRKGCIVWPQPDIQTNTKLKILYALLQ